MKNIHILSTDKPSRLIQAPNDILILLVELAENNEYNLNKHIYITSDEEIKAGEWVTNGLAIMKANLNGQPTMDDYHPWRKIILTTDQDLIKDGVQVIDDEFLEWFVKNPSCESVDVKKESEFYRSGPLDLLGYSIVTYKIIIPEKITRCCGRCNGVDDLCYSDMTCDNHKERGCEICYGKRIEDQIIIPKEESKQETLEEAADRYFPFAEKIGGETYTAYRGFMAGAKWQAEKICESEFIQLVRATKSDAEARRIIREYFK